MTLSVKDRIRLLVVMIVLLTVLVPSAGTSARQDDRTEAVTEAAMEVSRLEASGDLTLLHDRLQSDVRLLVSRAALAQWYKGPEAVIPTGDPEIVSIEFGTWTWPVTGRPYPDVATVTLRQRGLAEGAEIEQTEIQHYLYDGAHWRWFFGADAAFIDGLRQQVTADPELGPFGDVEYARINEVWAELYAQAGVEYRAPDEINTFTEDELPFQTGCGVLTEDDYSEAFYCELDQEIYYMLDFEEQIVMQFGDYAWTFALSHEWGHHIQFLEGLDSTDNPELDDGFYTIEMELQADCLAGVYGQEAVARGWATKADLEDAYQVAIFIGDSPGTTFDDPSAHGSAEQRSQAFATGLEDGLFGCNLYPGMGG